jgi:hypothetical protein
LHSKTTVAYVLNTFEVKKKYGESAFHNKSFVVTFTVGELHTYITVNWFMLKNFKLLEDFTFLDIIRSTISSIAGSSPKSKFKPKVCPRGEYLVSMWLHMLLSRT